MLPSVLFCGVKITATSHFSPNLFHINSLSSVPVFLSTRFEAIVIPHECRETAESHQTELSSRLTLRVAHLAGRRTLTNAHEDIYWKGQRFRAFRAQDPPTMSLAAANMPVNPEETENFEDMEKQFAVKGAQTPRTSNPMSHIPNILASPQSCSNSKPTGRYWSACEAHSSN